MKKQIVETIKAALGSQIFTVEFTKANGEKRVLNGRLGVKAGLREGAKVRTYDPEEAGYLVVWDLKKKGYRTVNTSTISSISCRGRKLEW